MAKTLIIYYSRKGQNYFSGAIKDISKGNTEILAEYIAEEIGADVFQVETVKEYSKDYNVCIDEAKKELRQKSRPELKKYLDNIDRYDNIIIAGPCWWGTYPCAVFSLIEKLDWTGKKVLPLMTHEGSGMGGSVKHLQQICKGASIGESLAVYGHEAKDSRQKVIDWVKKNL